MPVTGRLLFSVALAQGGEFAFVLFQFVGSNGVLPHPVTEKLISVVAISMYRQHNANLSELMTRDRKIDMVALDQAWTAANPET